MCLPLKPSCPFHSFIHFFISPLYVRRCAWDLMLFLLPAQIDGGGLGVIGVKPPKLSRGHLGLTAADWVQLAAGLQMRCEDCF